MQSFKQYTAVQNKPVEQGKLDASGVPCAVVNWRRPSHSNIGPDGVPCAVVTKPEKRPVSDPTSLIREDAENAPKGGYYGDREEWDDQYDNGHIGHGGQVHDHLVKADKTVGAKELEHVKQYTRDSAYLNRHLYNRHVDGEKHDDEVRGIHVKTMDKAVGRNKLQHDLHVYSGTSWHPGNIAKQHPARLVHLPAYTSTSIDKQAAHSFATGDENNNTHVIHFHLKKGQAGKYVEHHTENPGEHEFILPRNTTVHIAPRPDRYEDSITGQVTHVWHAHVMDKKE